MPALDWTTWRLLSRQYLGQAKHLIAANRLRWGVSFFKSLFGQLTYHPGDILGCVSVAKWISIAPTCLRTTCRLYYALAPGSRDHIPSGIDCLDPFCFIAQGDAWHTEEKCFFLHTSRIGQYETGLRFQEKDIEI